jgi:hypothetical protein
MNKLEVALMIKDMIENADLEGKLGSVNLDGSMVTFELTRDFKTKMITVIVDEEEL